jgi:hypothetical protein
MKHDEHSAPRGDRGLPVLLLLVAFGAGVTGGLVAHWMDTDPADSSPVSPSSADRDGSAQIAAEVHALTQAIERLGQRPAVSPASANAETSSVEPLRPDSSGASLEAAITRLVDALGRAGGPRAEVVDRAALSIPTDAQVTHSHLDALVAQARDDVRREHLFQSASDIIEHYGLPDEIEVHDRTVVMIYRSPDGRWQQSFSTLDGLVVNYYRSD